MKKLYILFAILGVFTLNAQIVVIDPGHGYGSTTSNNPDGRTATEIETSLSVGLKTRALIQNECSGITVQMTRTTNLNGWISVNQRAQMSNNWNADRLLSIHCNAGGGTGTETFYCTYDDTNTAPDIAFSKKIQADMVVNGAWNNRRCVEDNSYLAYHLGVLRYSSATACLSEIGFVDTSADAAKLNSDSWRNKFAKSYFDSFKASLNVSCNASPVPGSFTLTATPQCPSGTSSINLVWTASANATKYDIYRNGSLYASDITGTSFLNTYVTTGTTYTYYIKAKNATGSTNNSNGTLSRTANCAPGAFTVTTTATCSGTMSAINVTWTTAANATSYDIYRNGNLYASNVTGNSFLNTYLINPGVTYTFSMVAKNATGTIANSNGTRSATGISCAGRTNEGEIGSFVNDIVVYPNPSQDFINLKINKLNTSKINLNIFDMTGKLVRSFEANTIDSSIDQQIDISTLSNGTYFINGVIENREFVKKFVKN